MSWFVFASIFVVKKKTLKKEFVFENIPVTELRCQIDCSRFVKFFIDLWCIINLVNLTNASENFWYMLQSIFREAFFAVIENCLVWTVNLLKWVKWHVMRKLVHNVVEYHHAGKKKSTNTTRVWKFFEKKYVNS